MAPAIGYEFAAQPGKATGTKPILTLTGSSWRYNASGSDLGADWASLGYDDAQSGWAVGAGLFGFGVGAGVYPAPIQTALGAGPTTYYFRAPLTWDYDTTGVAFVVTNYLSDGAVFYLNGVEVKRVRMLAGGVTSGTVAVGGPEVSGKGEVMSLPIGSLLTGENVLAVEVHQAAVSPGELVFGLSLASTDSLAPIIEDASQPTNRTVTEGESTVFNVGSVLGSPPLTYQWLKDGVAIEGATSAVYTIGTVLYSDAGVYSVVIGNANGQTRSRGAELKTTATAVGLVDAGLPGDLTVIEGEPAILTVIATGSPPLSYVWYKDDAVVVGATAAEYRLGAAQLADGGMYQVVVSNRVSVVTSRKARLTVGRDTTSPGISRVTGSAKKVVVVFSEPVDAATAVAVSNYQVSGNLQVTGAVLDPADGRTVTLTTGAQVFGSVYTLGVSGVKDLYGNVANTVAPFRSSIIVDGDFGDWAGIPVVLSEPWDDPLKAEFKDFTAANDDEYLYLRFSFHAPVGPLPVNHYYHVNIDADGDAATGRGSGGIGVEVMIENGWGYQ